MNTGYWIIIYVIGCIASYWIIKKRRELIEADDWEDVAVAAFFSLLSWLSFVAIAVLWGISYLIEKISNIEGKPPKWL